MVFPTFAAWVVMHGKSYNETGEHAVREQIYNDNVAKIEGHNAKNLTYSMTVNAFADLTEEEFVARYSGLGPNPPRLVDANFGTLQEIEPDVDEVDWVKNGAVNPVKDQQAHKCSSCWAFSTAGTLESAYQIATGKLYSLSEQQLVDCADHENGCMGGYPSSAYDLYVSNAGMCSEASYQYTAKDGSCKASSCDVVVPRGSVTGHQSLDRTASALKSALLSQPVSVLVDAFELQFYANGVVTGECKGKTNHAVIAVGYGTDGVDYFKIRNSMGTDWGESGYVRLAQNGGTEGTACLFKMCPTVPTLSVESVLV